MFGFTGEIKGVKKAPPPPMPRSFGEFLGSGEEESLIMPQMKKIRKIINATRKETFLLLWNLTFIYLELCNDNECLYTVEYDAYFIRNY